jgi:hypothetical protein
MYIHTQTNTHIAFTLGKVSGAGGVELHDIFRTIPYVCVCVSVSVRVRVLMNVLCVGTSQATT